MTDQNTPALGTPDLDATHSNSELMADEAALGTLVPGFNTVIKINRTVRDLIIDYVLIAAILGLLPIYGTDWADLLGFLALISLNIKMVFHIRAHWGKPKRRGVFSIAGNFLNVLEGFAVGIVLRLLVSVVGLFIPLVVVLNGAVGHAVLTWIVGRSANHYYFGTRPVSAAMLKRVRHLDSPKASSRALKLPKKVLPKKK